MPYKLKSNLDPPFVTIFPTTFSHLNIFSDIHFNMGTRRALHAGSWYSNDGTIPLH